MSKSGNEGSVDEGHPITRGATNKESISASTILNILGDVFAPKI